MTDEELRKEIDYLKSSQVIHVNLSGRKFCALLEGFLEDRARARKLLEFAMWVKMRMEGTGVAEEASKVLAEYEASLNSFLAT